MGNYFHIAGRIINWYEFLNGCMKISKKFTNIIPFELEISHCGVVPKYITEIYANVQM